MEVERVDPPVGAAPAVEHHRGVGPLGAAAEVAQHGGAEADDGHHCRRHAQVPLQVEERQIELVRLLGEVLQKEVRHEVATVMIKK